MSYGLTDEAFWEVPGTGCGCGVMPAAGVADAWRVAGVVASWVLIGVAVAWAPACGACFWETLGIVEIALVGVVTEIFHEVFLDLLGRWSILDTLSLVPFVSCKIVLRACGTNVHKS